MVLGVPGAGKSMLMWHLAMCYADGNPILLPESLSLFC
jgi:predicted NACHT family NTPase